ncbi:stage III sporulation protein AA [Metabacillus fastidiosus]|uniref:stage III sporulation protein AA n=1 Tax=Metabacillus fastidiosus TaxID=1458 RepID=UPI002DC03B14|nr:stage III sporulation protein AA [Metabacillus fastidiosus]MEC2075403.1 stage III sporulation protein AA [Metabacillus fastidiosus]
MNEIMEILPDSIREHLIKLDHLYINKMEEIRIRINKRLEIVTMGKPIFLPYYPTMEDIMSLLNDFSQYSIYTLEEELKKGFITICGGHRVGMAGRVITEGGKVKAIRDITSYNIRIAREKAGIAEKYIPFVYKGKWLNTLIIGPPQTGKTTLLRDFARIISTGNETVASRKVGIIDERSEIAGSVRGIPQHTFGERVDVLDACPKAEGMMMMIRSMSPDVLVVDEIGRLDDTEAILEAVHAGVQLFVTVHGYTMRDLMKRPSLKPLLELNVFERFVELSRRNGPGTVQKILNNEGKLLLNCDVMT